jgi:hypothetical protein
MVGAVREVVHEASFALLLIMAFDLAGDLVKVVATAYRAMSDGVHDGDGHGSQYGVRRHGALENNNN